MAKDKKKDRKPAKGATETVRDAFEGAVSQLRRTVDDVRSSSSDDVAALRAEVELLKKRVDELESAPKPGAAKATTARRSTGGRTAAAAKRSTGARSKAASGSGAAKPAAASRAAKKPRASTRSKPAGR